MSGLEETRAKIRHIMLEFQVSDLKKCAQANFLVAIGLMTATEFLGGLITGKLGLKGKGMVVCRFEKGFEYLGRPYEELLREKKDTVMDIYDNIRCGLVHQYLPSQTEGIYGGRTADPGIVEINRLFKIIHENYTRDLEAAVNKLLEELETNKGLFQKVRQAVEQIPELA